MNNTNSRSPVFDRSWLAKPVAVFLTLMTFCLPFSGQTINKKQLANLNLSWDMRKKLIERFDAFVQYEKTQSYEKQFELLAKEHLETLLHMNVDKDAYVRFKQESQRSVGRLIELTVKDIKRIPNNSEQLSLSVVVKLQKGKITYSDTPICVAYLVNGDWRFSLLYVN